METLEVFWLLVGLVFEVLELVGTFREHGQTPGPSRLRPVARPPKPGPRPIPRRSWWLPRGVRPTGPGYRPLAPGGSLSPGRAWPSAPR